MDMCSKHGHDQGVLTFLHSRYPLALSSSSSFSSSNPRYSRHLVVLLHGRSVATFCRAPALPFLAPFCRRVLSHCHPLALSSSRILVLPHSHPLVVLLHGRSVATFCHASALPFLASSCRSVVLSFSGIVVLSDSRILVLPHFCSSYHSVAAFSRTVILSHCHPLALSSFHTVVLSYCHPLSLSSSRIVVLLHCCPLALPSSLSTSHTAVTCGATGISHSLLF
jgi:hypothetical protein